MFGNEYLIADRLGGTSFGKEDTIYKFEKIKRAKRDAIKANPDKELIDLGVGEPDEKAPDEIIEVLYKEAKDKANRFYADNGIEEFKQACAKYMDNRFGIKVDSNKEVNHAIGAKSALSMIPFIFINPGDITITTVPGYPVIGTLTKYLGGEIYKLPLLKENNFLPDLESIPEDILRKAKLLYLNYPNNPTGAIAEKNFIRKAVEFAEKYNIFIIHDAAYIELTYTDKQESFLSVENAKKHVLEIHSLSKSFNMTGWRIAFVCGNEYIVKAFAAVKDNMDSGQFIPIQKAASYALEHLEYIEKNRNRYKRRLTKLTEKLRNIGFYVNEPKGTFYLYFEIPKGIKNGPTFKTAEDFCEFLIREKMISSVPWDDAGHFIRFCVAFEASRKQEDNIIDEIEKRLRSEEYLF
ncbi:MAG: LL-diaminopimelate aminotransferase [Deferribacterota bacterium]|nr:LL-diaminopimelate aminotransferase [Deferribacterota bacterium]